MATSRDVYYQVKAMREAVERIATADSDQEFEAVGLISITAVLNLARQHLPDDPVFQQIDAMITQEVVRADGTARATDLLPFLVAVEGSLHTAAKIGDPPTLVTF